MRAFVNPVRHRKNLTVLTGAQAERILLSGRKATGLEFTHKGTPGKATVSGELILSAGAIGTPQILQLSGIGPGELLGKHGVDVVHDLPGVGENLQDHLQIRTAFKISGARTLNERQSTLSGKLGIALEYAFRRSGPMSMAPSQLGIFMKSDARFETPNIEFHVQPLSLDAFGQPLHSYPAITVWVCNLRPESRGSVRITSPRFSDHPTISPNYLSTAGDCQVAADSITAARRLMSTQRMSQYRPEEFRPGEHPDTRRPRPRSRRHRNEDLSPCRHREDGHGRHGCR